MVKTCICSPECKEPVPDGRAKYADEHWHGTVNGFNNKQCRCPRCREAWRIYSAAYRERRKTGETRPTWTSLLAEKKDEA
jgi:hypothetical protein